MIFIFGRGRIGQRVANKLLKNSYKFVRRTTDGKDTEEFSYKEFFEMQTDKNNNHVAILATPNDTTEELVPRILEKGITTIDAYYNHEKVVDYINKVEAVTKNNGTLALVCCGYGQLTKMLHAMLGNVFGANSSKMQYIQEGPHAGTRNELLTKFPQIHDAVCIVRNGRRVVTYYSSEAPVEIEGFGKTIHTNNLPNLKYKVEFQTKAKKDLDINFVLQGENPEIQASVFYEILQMVHKLNRKGVVSFQDFSIKDIIGLSSNEIMKEFL